MSAVTIEEVKAKQSELAKLIEQLQSKPTETTRVEIEGTTIELAPGEHYAGVVLGESGQVKHHLVLMAQRPTDKLNWKAACDWAKRINASLPTRQELSLLFANCKPHLQPVWHWSCEEHEDDASYAWGCLFDDGDVYGNRNSYEGSAVAVRRIPSAL